MGITLLTSARRVKRLFKGYEAEGLALPRVETRKAAGSHKRGSLEVSGDLESVMMVARATGGRLTSM